MQVVYKYTGLEVKADVPVQTLMMPEHFTICDAHCQRGSISLWAHVDTDTAIVPTKFRVFGTGWELTDIDGWVHIKTVHDGMFVWHIYLEL